MNVKRSILFSVFLWCIVLLSGCLSEHKNLDSENGRIDSLKIENYITDYANIISDDIESELNELGVSLKEYNGAQVVFITVDSLNGGDIREVAYNTFNNYQLGDSEKDNGILFIVSMKDKLRYMEVGRGLEGVITDIGSQHLQEDYLVPQFQEENYEKGIYDLYYKTVESVYYDGELSDGTNINNGSDESEDKSDLALSIVYTVFVLLIFLIVFLELFSSRGGSSCSHRKDFPDGGNNDFYNGGFSGGGGKSSGGGAGGSW